MKSPIVKGEFGPQLATSFKQHNAEYGSLLQQTYLSFLQPKLAHPVPFDWFCPSVSTRVGSGSWVRWVMGLVGQENAWVGVGRGSVFLRKLWVTVGRGSL